jgi:hypothetical protein
MTLAQKSYPQIRLLGKRAYYPVGVKHAMVDVVQTNNTSPMQLGEREDKLFGNTGCRHCFTIKFKSIRTKFWRTFSSK